MNDNLAQTIAEIELSKPNIPKEEILDLIKFKWNDESLSSWDGGHDLNAKFREKVVGFLVPNFKNLAEDYIEILRFLIQQEIENCCEGEFLSNVLRTCYDCLANYKKLEDVVLLLSANDDTSFDANSGLFKDRLFYNGYENVISYLKENKTDEDIIESIENYAAYFVYKT